MTSNNGGLLNNGSNTGDTGTAPGASGNVGVGNTLTNPTGSTDTGSNAGSGNVNVGDLRWVIRFRVSPPRSPRLSTVRMAAQAVRVEPARRVVTAAMAETAAMPRFSGGGGGVEIGGFSATYVIAQSAAWAPPTLDRLANGASTS